MKRDNLVIVVRPNGETSNTPDELFDTLADWQEQLKHIELPEFSDGPKVGP